MAAAQEERFTRKKHDHAFPTNAIDYCLSEAGIASSDLDYVVFYEKPLVKFERILETYLATAPYGISSFIKAVPLWVKKKLWMKDFLARELGYDGKILFAEHHESHAASAFYPSPFEEATILTLDGVGAAAIPEVRSRPTEMFVRSNLDFDVQARGVIEQQAADGEPVDGFVAVDLLRVDGTVLLDVPLLERKRLLESVIAPGPLLRVSEHVRPPADPWVATWKSMGLAGGILKAAYSRYHPSDDTVEWRLLKRLNRRR